MQRTSCEARAAEFRSARCWKLIPSARIGRNIPRGISASILSGYLRTSRINRLLFTDPYPALTEDPSGLISRVGKKISEVLPGNPELAEKLTAHLTGLDEVRCLKPSLHAEIDLEEKNHGIVVKPCWSAPPPATS